MLRSLYIQNYALIEKLDISFSSGFSVITGETGAGKSIILGAIGLLLGQRADVKAIRVGASKCIIEARFDISAYGMQPFFEENELEYEEECLLRREVSASGKSRAFINDTPASLAQMKELGEQLIDVHSQHQNLLLNKEGFQLNVLDILSHNEEALSAYQHIFGAWKQAQQDLEALVARANQDKSDEDYIRFQLEQLEEAHLSAGEQEELEQEADTLSHAEEIKAGLYRVGQTLYSDEGGLLSGLKECLNTMLGLQRVYPVAGELAERMESTYIELKDISQEVSGKEDEIEFNPERLDEVNERLNFNFEELKPKESWDKRLKKLMEYFENDTQLRDILITGGDALMSQNKTLRNILEAVYKMAVRKRNANLQRAEGEKYAELQRVRLGSRLPVYLPMRINDELLDILREFKEKASAVGVSQFLIQTHFQTPLEVTPEAREAIRKILAAGWTITNQLVYNVAASRRGHTAKLRKVLNGLGVLCYYTFSVKGFEENYAVFAPNSRSLQEKEEEKVWGKLSAEQEKEFLNLLRNSKDRAAAVQRFCTFHQIPFVATDRSVLNLPGIGKSMTFVTIGMTKEGKRILEFDHDPTRQHSPIIHQMEKIYIKENKSIWQYMLQLQEMGEKKEEYASLWKYMEGETEHRFPLYNYPDPGFRITEKYSHLSVAGNKSIC